MNTKILFNIDLKVKERAQKRAARDGITLSSMLKSATRAYADDDPSFEPALIPKKSLIRKLDKAHKDYLAGKNISPAFTNMEDAILYLDRYVSRKRR